MKKSMMAVARHSGEIADYAYSDARPNPSHGYLWPVLDAVVQQGRFPDRRAFDVGCGNGTTSERLRQQGFSVIGVDVAEQGIDIARRNFPGIDFNVDSVYGDLANKYGTFPLVVCLEVIEHLYDPRQMIRTIHALLQPGGTLVLSTPYHGYWKNLGLAVMGKWDFHHQPLRHGGHVKFFAVDSLTRLLVEEGLEVVRIERVGRGIPAFARSMVAVAHKRGSAA